MYSYNQVKELIAQWAASGMSAVTELIKIAEATIGWPYVWGASGAECIPSKRTYYAGRTVCPDGEKKEIAKKCQVLNGSKSACPGCPFYPNNERVLINDCQGWVKWIMKQIGITLTGGGCTSMWNTNSLWSEKGELKDMPSDLICCVFKQNQKDKKTMEHIGLHVGGGKIIHCSGTVKTGSTSEKGWTHFGVPKGLGGSTPTPTPTRPTLRKGSRGENVKYLQQKLIELGYDLGSYGADGAFGAKTETAVKKFQKDNGLTADGVVGAATWTTLEYGVPKEVTYTVRIPHLSKTDADELLSKYEGSTCEKE